MCLILLINGEYLLIKGMSLSQFFFFAGGSVAGGNVGICELELSPWSGLNPALNTEHRAAGLWDWRRLSLEEKQNDICDLICSK